MYRRIRSDEAATYAELLMRHAEWYRFMEQGAILFGPNMQKLEIEVQGEYNDEGGTSYYVTNIAAYDESDNQLQPTVDGIVAMTTYTEEDEEIQKLREVERSGESFDEMEDYDLIDIYDDLMSDVRSEFEAPDYTYTFTRSEAVPLPDLYLKED